MTTYEICYFTFDRTRLTGGPWHETTNDVSAWQARNRDAHIEYIKELDTTESEEDLPEIESFSE